MNVIEYKNSLILLHVECAHNLRHFRSGRVHSQKKNVATHYPIPPTPVRKYQERIQHDLLPRKI